MKGLIPVKRFWIHLAVALAVTRGAFAAEYSFPVPSGDRWFYPFNFTPGTRGISSLFAAAFDGFNDRDGEIILAWDTSVMIEPGLGPEAYEIDAIRIVMTNQANQFINPNWPIDVTVDEWFTFDINGDGVVNADGIPRGAPGDTDGESDDIDPGRPIELFGAGFADDGPFTEATWSESSIYIGSASTADIARNPFPFVFDATENKLHVEDSIMGLHNEALGVMSFTPQPWAVGVPVGYTPGMQSTPFDITFDLDLSSADEPVRRYFQEQLNRGRIIVIVTTLRETEVQGPTSGYPSIYMKEGLFEPGAKPAGLTVTLSSCDASGDVNGDDSVDPGDVAAFTEAALGMTEDPDTLERADVNCDGVVDGRDVQPLLQSMF